MSSQRSRKLAVAGIAVGIVIATSTTSAFASCSGFARGHHHHVKGGKGTTTTTVVPTSTTLKPTTTTTTSAPATTTTTAKATTTTTAKPATTTSTTGAPASGAGTCTNPFASTSEARGAIDIGNSGVWSVRNEAWNDTHGPQTIFACSEQSWYVTSNQPDLGGAVQTYPDTLYAIGGTKPISQYKSITSTFAEQYPAQGSWNAAYDLWMNDYSKEVMIWNEWNGGPGYWPTQAKTAVTLNGVPYHFLNNGGELMFFRDTPVKSGSVDILAAYNWLVSQNLLKSTDVPTQLEYGVEICSTVGTQTFPTTGVTFSLS